MSSTITGMDSTARVRGVQYKQRAYGWNGPNAMRGYDGANWNFAGIRGPMTNQAFTPSVAAAGGSGNLTGSYVWILAPVNSKHSNGLGQVIAGQPSQVSAPLALNNQNASITNIPATHADPQVDYWFLYRTLAGGRDSVSDDEGVDYHYVDKIPIGTTSYTDSAIDDQIKGAETVRFNQMFPPNFKFGALYGDRLFGAGMDNITAGTATLATKTITNKALTSDVATITCSAAHGYSVGDYVTVNTGSHDRIFDGCWIITATGGGGTTFSYNRNNNQINVASAAETGTTEKITFAGVSLPDGIVGAFFQKTGDSRIYQIAGRNSSTEIAIVGVGLGAAGFSGSLSGATYTIFRYGWQIYYSEQYDVEAWGADGLGFINTKEIPGRDAATALLQYNNRLWVFSDQNIYYITGIGANTTDVQMSPEAIYRGLGCVGPDALDTVEGEIHLLTLRGPAVMVNGAAPQLYGQSLLTDWLDSLNNADLALSVVICSGRYVYYFVTAATGDAEVSKAFRYDRNTGLWWEQTRWNPKFGFHDNGDNGLNGRAYFCQGGSIFEPNNGFVDMADQVYTGTIKTLTTLQFTDSAVTFPTAAGGLLEAYVEFFDTSNPPVSKGVRRIKGQADSHTISWLSTGVGGGALTLQVGWTYVIGAIHWKWQTRVLQTPGKSQKSFDANIVFDRIDASAKLRLSKIYDNASGESQTDAVPIEQTAGQKLVKKFTLNTGQFNFAMILESYTNARVRQALLDMGTGDDNRGV